MHLKYLSRGRPRGASDVKEKPIVDVIKVRVAQTSSPVFKGERERSSHHRIPKPDNEMAFMNPGGVQWGINIGRYRTNPIDI
jgi:hypothetical protein